MTTIIIGGIIAAICILAIGLWAGYRIGKSLENMEWDDE